MHAHRALVLAAAAEQRGQREVRLAVVDVVVDHLAQLGHHDVVIAGDVVGQRLQVVLRVAGPPLERAIVGHVVAADQHAGGQRA